MLLIATVRHSYWSVFLLRHVWFRFSDEAHKPHQLTKIKEMNTVEFYFYLEEQDLTAHVFFHFGSNIHHVHVIIQVLRETGDFFIVYPAFTLR